MQNTALKRRMTQTMTEKKKWHLNVHIDQDNTESCGEDRKAAGETQGEAVSSSGKGKMEAPHVRKTLVQWGSTTE